MYEEGRQLSRSRSRDQRKQSCDRYKQQANTNGRSTYKEQPYSCNDDDQRRSYDCKKQSIKADQYRVDYYRERHGEEEQHGEYDRSRGEYRRGYEVIRNQGQQCLERPPPEEYSSSSPSSRVREETVRAEGPAPTGQAKKKNNKQARGRGEQGNRSHSPYTQFDRERPEHSRQQRQVRRSSSSKRGTAGISEHRPQDSRGYQESISVRERERERERPCIDDNQPSERRVVVEERKERSSRIDSERERYQTERIPRRERHVDTNIYERKRVPEKEQQQTVSASIPPPPPSTPPPPPAAHKQQVKERERPERPISDRAIKNGVQLDYLMHRSERVQEKLQHGGESIQSSYSGRIVSQGTAAAIAAADIESRKERPGVAKIPSSISQAAQPKSQTIPPPPQQKPTPPPPPPPPQSKTSLDIRMMVKKEIRQDKKSKPVKSRKQNSGQTKKSHSSSSCSCSCSSSYSSKSASRSSSNSSGSSSGSSSLNPSSSSSSRSSSSSSASDSKDRTKDAGHYQYRIGECFCNNRYRLIKHIFDGTFGRVVEVIDLQSPSRRVYAMKIIRAVPRYIEAAQTETQILEKINSQEGACSKYRIVQLEATFKHGENYCMVFESLGLSLYELLKKNEYVGYGIRRVQSFFKQLAESISFLHSNRLTHTDLKPENILFVSKHLIEDKKNKELRATKYWIPSYTDDIKLVDFGGATFAEDDHTEIINTRQYRAPEVILGCCKWNEVSDVWSLGCIIFELLSGELLFPTHDNYQHLAMIEKICGTIPLWMASKTHDKDLLKCFNFEQTAMNNPFQKTFLTWPRGANKKLVDKVIQVPTIEIYMAGKNPELTNLLRRCLTIDPKLRIQSADILKHPFFLNQYM